MRAIGVAEVITPSSRDARTGSRLATCMAALARAGVTATCSRADGPRYGSIDVDSNLPDVRIALGGPAENPFTAEVLAAAGPAARRATGSCARPGAALGAGHPDRARTPSRPAPTCAARVTCRC